MASKKPGKYAPVKAYDPGPFWPEAKPLSALDETDWCFLNMAQEAHVTKKEKQFVDDMKRCRGIEFARLGMMVEVDGNLGTIVGMNSSANLDVVFANQLKFGKHPENCHPTWRTRYFDSAGNVIADYCQQPQPGAKHG